MWHDDHRRPAGAPAARFHSRRARRIAGTLALLLVVPMLLSCAAGNAASGADDGDSAAEGAGAQSGIGKILEPVASAEEAMARGREAVQQGDLERGMLEFVRASELAPDDPAPLGELGRLHYEQGNQSLAALAFRMAIQVDDAHAPAHEGLGLVLMRTRNHADARGHFERAVLLDRSLWRSHNALGILADLDGDFATAVSHYQHALALLPRSAMVLSNLGYSYYLQGDTDRAMAAFEQAVAAEPRYFVARRNLALIHVMKDQFETAVELLKVDTSEIAAYNDVGYLCILAGKYVQAERYLKRAIDLSPSYYARAHENLELLRRRMTTGHGVASAGGLEDTHAAGFDSEVVAAARSEQDRGGTPHGVAGPSAQPRQASATADASTRVGHGSRLAERIEATRRWLEAQRGDEYTIQLMTSEPDGEAGLAKFLQAQEDRGLLDETFVSRSRRNGQAVFVVLYRSFAGFSEAARTIESLPGGLRAYRPIVRNIADFRSGS